MAKGTERRKRRSLISLKEASQGEIMYHLVFSAKSRKSLRKLRESGRFNEPRTAEIINSIASGKTLDPRHRNHKLQGVYRDCFECHIKNDLLLIYKIDTKQTFC